MGVYPNQRHADQHLCASLRDGTRDEGGLERAGQWVLWIAGNLWWWLRQVSGDADYENYMRRGLRDSFASEPEGRVSRVALSAQEFYLENLRRKHSRINRCC